MEFRGILKSEPLSRRIIGFFASAAPLTRSGLKPAFHWEA